MTDTAAAIARLEVPDAALEISAYRSGADLVIALDETQPHARRVGRIVLEQFYAVDHSRVLLGEWKFCPGPTR